MTRKRTRESLGQLLTSPCPHCQGSGRVRSVETLAHDALRRVQHEATLRPGPEALLLRVHPEVADFLGAGGARSLASLEAFIGRPVTVETTDELSPGDVEVARISS